MVTSYVFSEAFATRIALSFVEEYITAYEQSQAICSGIIHICTCRRCIQITSYTTLNTMAIMYFYNTMNKRTSVAEIENLIS